MIYNYFSPQKYLQFVQGLGVCLHIGKHTLYFEGSVNVGGKKEVSASLTFLITLPQPGSVMHAKCCLWEPHEERLPGVCLKEGY